MPKDFSIKFWGVRGSYPKTGPTTVQYGGNTSCVEVRVGGQLLILDAGTGIIPLGGALVRDYLSSHKDPAKRTPVEATIYISHTHHDHTQGIPFFAPIFMGSSTLHFVGPRTLGIGMEDVLDQMMAPHVFPVQWHNLAAEKVIHTIRDTDIIIYKNGNPTPDFRDPFRSTAPIPNDAVKLTMMRSYAHPHGGVLVFKIQYKGKTLVFATDTEGYVGGDRKLIAFAQGADLLIHDSQYKPSEYEGMPSVQGYGHSTPDIATGVAKASGAKRLALFHFNPPHDDETISEMLRYSQKLFPATLAASEGLELEL